MKESRAATPRKMLVISPAAFISSLAIGTVNLGLLFIIKDLYGASASQIGWLGALWSIAYFVGCFVFKKLTARLTPRLSMGLMQAGSALILTGFLLRPGLWQAFAAIIAYGFITAFFWPPLMGWLSRGAETTALSRATSQFNLSWSLGSVASPWLAGLLAERGKFLPVAAAIVFFAGNALYILVSRLFIKDDEEQLGRGPAARAGQIDRSTPLRFPAWLGIVLTYMVVGVSLNVFPVFARDVLKMSESATGFVLTLRALTTMITFGLLGRYHFWQFRRRLLPFISILMAGLLLALVFVSSSLSYMIGFGLFGVLMAVTYNNSLFYATSGALDRDKRVNAHETLLTFGSVTGSVSGGVLYQGLSLPVVFIMLASLLGLGAVAQMAMLRRSGRTNAGPPVT
ncbi:MAG: hypothetical protein A2087_14790 [Spirochaetes bacterium GWD1_61_31]|nr:MAG: hypothetical protein A2Y37_12865 [Spirochaetes bacterium GWB1_60_80]OHD28675.1 MAG: hypothetical protein A2004_05815 [Spirochaetes bacterium GWC1_61_12]OHD38904.1 MAG: hypothetical protein A2087_14790 [Spirochaetes bacterium GWD1_61_31]OHD43317.1 MAG: hypothetical protein A2Y35_08560 [Spirochaetes bacterium GWE1_60_18]OHD58855.1 MAG: hypothetical protein A2Y32_08930 [Spirochaetes bacterium GWF1_60_12]HAP42509.1 hypothetical protein [Spirochaetaceae bacterium]